MLTWQGRSETQGTAAADAPAWLARARHRRRECLGARGVCGVRAQACSGRAREASPWTLATSRPPFQPGWGTMHHKRSDESLTLHRIRRQRGKKRGSRTAPGARRSSAWKSSQSPRRLRRQPCHALRRGKPRMRRPDGQRGGGEKNWGSTLAR